MRFSKNHPFMASPSAETSDIIKNVPLLATLVTDFCAKGKQVTELYT